ncbi:hypothetical protein BH24CHL10_BH24CHL10_06070 [soil metagenome]
MARSFASSMQFAACSADAVVANRSAISASVSPASTTYVSCAGAGGAAGAMVGDGVARGAALGVGVSVGVSVGVGVGVETLVGAAVGVARSVAVGSELGESRGLADACAGAGTPTFDVPGSSLTIPPTMATPPIPRTAPATPMASSGPVGVRRARPAIPRHAGSGDRTMRVETRPPTTPVLARRREEFRFACARNRSHRSCSAVRHTRACSCRSSESGG